MFKGYVVTKDKKSIESIKNRLDFKTYDEIKHYIVNLLEYYSEDTMLVDIDNQKESDILFKLVKDGEIKCRVYKTRRGKHFYFKNKKINKNSTGTKLVIGLTADIKIGLKNSYGILKYDNEEREILYSTDKIEEIPYFYFLQKEN